MGDVLRMPNCILILTTVTQSPRTEGAPTPEQVHPQTGVVLGEEEDRRCLSEQGR